MFPGQQIPCSGEIGIEQLFVAWDVLERFQEFRRPGHCAQVLRSFSREEPRCEVGTVRGQFEQRLIEEQFQHVLPPDIDYKCQLGLQCVDISKVLLRTDTDIDRTRIEYSRQLRKKTLVIVFIGHKVLVTVIAVRLREIGDDFPELIVAQLRRKALGSESCGADQEESNRQQYRSAMFSHKGLLENASLTLTFAQPFLQP